MKKQYIIPSMSVVRIGSMQMLSGSVKGSNGIGYGGVDNNGTVDPASRSHKYYDWDDDDEEEDD